VGGEKSHRFGEMKAGFDNYIKRGVGREWKQEGVIEKNR